MKPPLKTYWPLKIDLPRVKNMTHAHHVSDVDRVLSAYDAEHM